jgi:5-methylcytosine-specific restriction endonuclease McrA
VGRKITNDQGNQYDRLYVICEAGRDKGGHAQWLCMCDCGEFKVVSGVDLRSGHTQSCGCLQKERVSELMKGKNNPMYGKTGKNHPNYKHGLTKTKEYGKQYYKDNPDKLKEKSRKRRALKAGAEGTHTIEDLKYIYNHQQGKCLRCKKFILFEKITVDHIVPLSWGGSDYPSNIQLLCRRCNSSKSNRHATDYRSYEI